MLTICFYQDRRNDKVLVWIRKKLGIGYISRRNDGITELRINGYETVGKLLKTLMPYLKVKKRQAEILIKSSRMLRKSKNKLDKETLKRLANHIYRLQTINYTTKRKKSLEEIYSILGLTL